jgi:hypothetical protein
MQEVRTCPITGSIVALYEPARLESMEFQFAVTSALGVSVTDVDLSGIASWTETRRNGDETLRNTTVSEEIKKAFSALNQEVARATGNGMDLRILVPIALCALGVRSLLVAEKVSFPAWHDYVWFGFGSYFMLNRNVPAPS